MSPNEKIIGLRKKVTELKEQLTRMEEGRVIDRFWLIVTAFLALASVWKTVILQWFP